MQFSRLIGFLAIGLVAMLPQQATAGQLLAPSVESSSFVSSVSETASYFGLSEVRVGGALSNLELIPFWLFIPETSSFGKARFDSGQFDIYFKSPFPDVPVISMIRPSIGGIVNFGGYEDLVHAGIDAHIPIGDTPFYAEAGFGVGVHTGYLNNAPPGFHDLGCPVLLHWTYGVGANINEHVTATVAWQHMSNVVFGCNPNQGLNNLGLTVGWKF